MAFYLGSTPVGGTVSYERLKKWTFTLASNLTSVYTVATDPDVAAHYADRDAIARYIRQGEKPSAGRWYGEQRNMVIGSQYGGYYSQDYPVGSPSQTALSNTGTSSKAMIATSAGELKIVGTSANPIAAGTYDVIFMW